MIAALFDADGTLYTAQFGSELTKHLSSQGRRWYGCGLGGKLRLWRFVHGPANTGNYWTSPNSPKKNGRVVSPVFRSDPCIAQGSQHIR